MIKFFQDKFALSLEGAKDLRISIFTHFLLNLSFMLPIFMAFIFLDDYMKVLLKSVEPTYGILFYTVFGTLFLCIMYIVAKIDYSKTYTKTYNESAFIRIELAQRLAKMPLSFFAKKELSDLSSTVMEDISQIEQIFSHAVPQIFAAIFSMIVMAVCLFIYNVPMSIATFWIVPFGFLIFYLSKKSMSFGNKQIYLLKRQISKSVQDGIEMISEIKSYDLENKYISDFKKQLQDYEQNLIKTEFISAVFLNLSHFTLKLGLPSVVLAGAYFLSKGSIDVFTYLVFLIIAGRIYDPFIDVINNFAVLLHLNARIERMKEMKSITIQEGTKEFNPKNFDIEFKNVSFSYDKNLQTLQDISFVAKQGEITALIGPSGGGKSTTSKLSARFWDIDKGNILIGGIDISTIDPEVLLKYFSIVFQDVTLFNTSVLENIRLGKKDASDDEVKKVAKLAMCDEFVNSLSKGYDTQIGENGEKLSGGQRQRISIARALLKDAPIILLDEATASLDAENETKVQQAISQLVKNKTVIIIAHRMRTIANADKIIAIKDGKIAEMGSVEELKQKDGLFANMIKLQTRY